MKKLLNLAAAVAALVVAGAAEIALDPPFQDNMVLQREQTIPVRGQAAPLAVVEVSLGKVSGRSVSAPDGRFTVRLPAQTAAEKLELLVRCGKETLRLQNVAVGDVYLVSGQSNMEYQLKYSKPGMDKLTPDDYRGLRYFKIRLRVHYGEQRSVDGKWRELTPDNAGECSGVGFFFGRAVRRATGVPVGLIDASRGGTNIEAWISRESLLAHPVYRDEVRRYDALVSGPGAEKEGKLPKAVDLLNSGIMRLFPTEPDDAAVAADFAKPDFDDRAWESMYIPDSWTQAGHNHAGIFWFRREVELPPELAGKELELHLGAVDKADRVYFNGTLVGQTGESRKLDAWNRKRVYKIPAELVRAGKNLLAVRAASMVSICFDGGLIGPEEEMYIVPKAGGKGLPLAGMWRYRETYDAGTEGMTFMRTSGAGGSCSFHMLYDNMILPIKGFPLRGVLWYQGEANAICMARTYRALLNSLIADWRRNFGDPELDFFVVQLPDFGTKHYFAPHSQWALIREAQQQSARDRGADCVVTLGAGEVDNIHPHDKRAVGEAAAKFAVARIGGAPAPEGPVFAGMTRKDATLRLTFTGGKLEKTGTQVSGFAVAAADGIVHPAEAVVTGEHTMEVTSPAVAHPEMVWYAWGDNPVAAGLRGADGTPASPFRASLNGGPEAAVGRNLIHRRQTCRLDLSRHSVVVP